MNRNTMNVAARRRGWPCSGFRKRKASILWLLVWVIAAGDLRAKGESPSPSAAGRVQPWLPEGVAAECLFLPRTAIPMLAIGIRRVDDDPELRRHRLLDLWERPESVESGVEPLARVPLFRPYFVYGRRTADGTTWHLLGSDYAGKPLGWADGRQLRLLDSRYGYHFDNPKRVPPGVHLYGSRETAYEALEAQSQVPPKAPLENVVVAERLEEENWNPLGENAIPPFIELADEENAAERFAAGLTDTTLTFPFPTENHLIRLGAVAGGPVDRDEIEKKRKATQERAGIAIVFVIDETLSMQQFFGEVAEFIDKNLDLGQDSVNVRVAVCWFSDIEKAGDVPHVVQSLQPLNGAGMDASAVQAAKQRIVSQVREHEERLIGRDGAQPEELIYPGLIAAIKSAGFAEDENAMVFVIGDAPDRSGSPGLAQKLFPDQQKKLAALLVKPSLQVAFVQVGDVAKVGTGFTDQARAFRETLSPDQQKRLLVQGPGAETLPKRIADLQAQMERQRTALLEEIAEMETRNRYAEPGPELVKQLGSQGIDRKTFDQSHLQVFIPAWGWRYHPQQSEATPQLRELVFLAMPESDALIPALIKAADGLEKEGRIDVEAARTLLADVLGKRSGHTTAGRAIEAAWQSLPEGDRTFGRFLVQGMGMRVRNPLLFHRGTASTKALPTRECIELLRSSRERVGSARKDGVTWADAWRVLP